ncbi:tyrosine-protein phosphatase [Streptomyces sp. NPDC058991]|uniref:tyrosine-protein phosphatase n=1 Tax=unclassified Streptomyces TaxID=2593676 RepID=UPI0036D201DD
MTAPAETIKHACFNFFHCASGKDRTGLPAALVPVLMGVSEADTVEDFALTQLATGRLPADWPAAHGRGQGAGVARLRTRTGGGHDAVPRGTERRHGAVRGYAANALGVDAALTEALRQRLLTPAAGMPAPASRDEARAATQHPPLRPLPERTGASAPRPRNGLHAVRPPALT